MDGPMAAALALLAAACAAGQRLRIANGCMNETIWLAHMASRDAGPDAQNVELKPGSSFVFNTSNLSGTRYWPKVRCNAHGDSCELGESGGPLETCDNSIGCAPPVDTKFEASFGQNGVDWVDVSLVDGWTLPFKFEMSERCNAGDGNRGIERVVDCSKLSFHACPHVETVGNASNSSVSLQVVNPSTGNVVGCYAPCSKLTFNNWGNREARFAPADPSVAEYCCPTPPVSPEACRKGPVGRTEFVQAVHRDCPGVYGYSYDDGMGLILCPDSTYYKMTFYCPVGLKPVGELKHTTRTTTQIVPEVCQTPIWSVRTERDAPNDNTTFKIVKHTIEGWENYVSLETPQGKFVAAEPDGFVRADRTTVSFWELFTMTTDDNSKVSFKSFNGFYLAAEPYGSVRAQSLSVGEREQFTMVSNNEGTVALKSFDGRYMFANTACKNEVAEVIGTCFEKDIAYSPLDMLGQGITLEDQASSCQARCKATKGCGHFTFFIVGGYCHLTYSHALRMLGSLGAIAGPGECEAAEYIRKVVVLHLPGGIDISRQALTKGFVAATFLTVAVVGAVLVQRVHRRSGLQMAEADRLELLGQVIF